MAGALTMATGEKVSTSKAADITKRLAKFIKDDIEVTVSIVEFKSQKIFVFGAVINPRTITFSSAPSLLDVIMAQCIPTPDADLTAVVIMCTSRIRDRRVPPAWT